MQCWWGGSLAEGPAPRRRLMRHERPKPARNSPQGDAMKTIQLHRLLTGQDVRCTDCGEIIPATDAKFGYCCRCWDYWERQTEGSQPGRAKV